MDIVNKIPTHEGRAARWLGEECYQQILAASAGLRYPIPIANIPGDIYAYDGRLYGTIRGGDFTSLSDIIYSATKMGKRQSLEFYKTGILAAAQATESLWRDGVLPSTGGDPPGIPAGITCGRTSQGALKQADPTCTDTLRIVSMTTWATSAPNTLILYDRLWHAGGISLSVVTTYSVTGQPSRYTGADAKGNVAFVEVTTSLTAGYGHYWTVTYVGDNGNTYTVNANGIMGAVATQIDNTPLWYAPLNTNSYGVQYITSLTLNGAVPSGTVNWVIGHPLVFIPQPGNNYHPIVVDLVNTFGGLVKILTNAALAFISLRGQGNATTYAGQVVMVSG